MTLKPYPETKPSGIAWLGAIPENWNMAKLKYMCDFINGAPFKPDEWQSVGTPIIRIQNLNGGEDFNFSDKELDERYHVQAGDLLFGWSGNKGTSFGPYVWLREGHYYLNQHIFRIANYRFHKMYLYWLLKAVTTHIESETHGIIGLVHITKEDLGVIEVPQPCVDEQQTIAAYLDHKTAQIDAVIREKEEQIRLLAEQRQAVISYAVTRGLDPDAPLKPSGIAWLGDIPAHWDIKRLKYLSSIKYGLGQPPSQQDEGIPLLRATNVERGKINPLGLMFIDPNDVPYSRDPILRTGDILVVRSGAYTGDSAIVPSEYDGAIAGYDMVVRAKGSNPYYLAYSLLSDPILTNQINLQRLRAAQPHLNAEELGDCLLFMPPLSEQESIVKYLDVETARLDGIIQTLTQQICELRDYRQSLISAVVTGKVDVREAAR